MDTEGGSFRELYVFIFNCYKEDSHKHNSLILDRYSERLVVVGFTIFPLWRLFRWPSEHKEESENIYIQRVKK